MSRDVGIHVDSATIEHMNVLRNILRIVPRNVLRIVRREHFYVCDVLQHIILADLAFHKAYGQLAG